MQGNGQIMNALRSQAAELLKKGGLSDKEKAEVRKISRLPKDRDYSGAERDAYQAYLNNLKS